MNKLISTSTETLNEEQAGFIKVIPTGNCKEQLFSHLLINIDDTASNTNFCYGFTLAMLHQSEPAKHMEAKMEAVNQLFGLLSDLDPDTLKEFHNSIQRRPLFGDINK